MWLIPLLIFNIIRAQALNGDPSPIEMQRIIILSKPLFEALNVHINVWLWPKMTPPGTIIPLCV